jgi:hypothetical protein
MVFKIVVNFGIVIFLQHDADKNQQKHKLL